MLWKNFRQKIKKSPNEQGQAMIEFTLGLMIVISFFFFYVKMAAAFAIGNYVHYATFMAARAYSSSAATPDQQTQNAEAVLQKMVAFKWPAFVTPVNGDSSVKGAHVGQGPLYDAQDNAWNQGASFSYDIKLSLYPWTTSGGNGFPKISLTSESWMAREESVQECTTKKATIAGLIKNVPAAASLEWDNGC
jgi:hypothetical protein